MTSFMIHFLFCNCILAIAIGIIFAAKGMFRNYLSGQMQYRLWFLILILMVIPFLPIHFAGYRTIFSGINSLMESLTKITQNDITTQTTQTVTLMTGNSSSSINDFAVSISQKTPSFIGAILFCIWMTGIFLMLIRMVKPFSHLVQIKRSALPLQNQDIRKVYDTCLKQLQINRKIPIYSTAFLKSPALFGSFKPCIILPHHIISDFDHNPLNLRYIFLHELEHYKSKDNFVNIWINLGVILYWFNPLVHIALRQMQNDREIACDSAVLWRLNENEYQDYGNTLINLAEKLSFMSSPFAAGMSGTMKQMKQRIITIASYKKPTNKQRKSGILACVVIATVLLAFIPTLSTQASNDSYYSEPLDAAYNIYAPKTSKPINRIHDSGFADIEVSSQQDFLDSLNFTDLFKETDGTFVLYDTNNDTWHIYNEALARTRFSPVSTYKIYDALLALEQGTLFPDDTLISWDGTSQPFKVWEQDQTLSLAMQNSVNWYFQTLDAQMGINVIQNYLEEINYGNETAGTNISTYWGDGTLTISPIEQVKLLKQFNQNELPVHSQNTAIVKESICITDNTFTSYDGTLYGKTGTARIQKKDVNGWQEKDVNGWFIGFVETADNTLYFATFIQAEDGATGDKAAEITHNIFFSVQHPL